MKKLLLNLVVFLPLISFEVVSADKFSPLEIQMDVIANEHARDTSKLLTEMEKLLDNQSNATVEEQSLFLAYDCSLRANLAPKLASSRFEELKKLSSQHYDNYSVRAATALCESTLAMYENKESEYQTAIYKAFIYVQKAELATLKYWININIYSLFDFYFDFENAEKALKNGLNVALANQDNARLATVNQLLSENYIKQGKYQEALKYNKFAFDAIALAGEHYYQSELLISLGEIKLRQGLYEESTQAFTKALSIIQKRQNANWAKYVEYKLALLAALQGDTEQAQALQTLITDYAQNYDNEFLKLVSDILAVNIATTSATNATADKFAGKAKSLAEKRYYWEAIELWQEQLLILQSNEKLTGYNDSLVQYNELKQTISAEKFQTLGKLLKNTIDSIISDGKDIADYNLAMATSQQAEHKKYNQYLVLAIALLSFLLLAVTIKSLLHIRKRYLHKREELNRQRFCDPLTNAYNRRYFDEVIVPKIIKSSRSKQTSYLIVIDIDHFKSFNDTYGHSAGDIVLTELVSALQSDSRLQDSIIRLGGEEFLIALPPNENLRIEVFIERILKLISQKQIVIEDTPKSITVSIGYTPVCKANSIEDIEDLMNLADKALYRSKERGRNRATGISELQCPPNYIDNIEIAHDNRLLSLNEISPK